MNTEKTGGNGSEETTEETSTEETSTEETSTES